MGAPGNAADWPLGAPFVICVVLVMLYARGGRGRSHEKWRAAAFYGGVATIVLALDTPIDAQADTRFWVHMIQHVLLLTVAPPLLVLGRPWPRLWQPLPVSARRRAARVFAATAPLAHPAVALAVMSATIAAWHVPAFYNETLRNGFVHQLEHLSFVVTAVVFWAAVLGAPPLRVRLGGAARCAYLVLAMVPGWVLAIVLASARRPLYAYLAVPGHAAHTVASLLADQQLAAGVMWVPGSIAYVVAAGFSLYSWLEPDGSRQPPQAAVRDTTDGGLLDAPR